MTVELKEPEVNVNAAAPDQAKLEALSGKVIGDVAGAVSLFMSFLGDQAGVYAAMDKAGAATVSELAAQTGLREKYLREWLSANAAAGYIEYNAKDETFFLTPEQATIFSREGQPMCMQGFFQSVVALYDQHEKSIETFRTGEGRSWGEQSPCMFCGVDRFFRPGYAAHLTTEWIPALAGVADKLQAGIKVADIGCGYGSSTLLMAKQFPNSTFFGYDFHEPSIMAAREKAEMEGLDNVFFEVASATSFSGTDFGFVCIFDALHDMGDPVGAARHIRENLAPGGTFMLVEPLAGDSLSVSV